VDIEICLGPEKKAELHSMLHDPKRKKVHKSETMAEVEGESEDLRSAAQH